MPDTDVDCWNCVGGTIDDGTGDFPVCPMCDGTCRHPASFDDDGED